MKKILISLSIIGVVAAVALGITAAFFNDTETSTGNILIAGKLDLKVDSQKAQYDGMICNGTWQCEPWADYVVSYNPGPAKYTPLPPADRMDPTKALGPAQNNDTINFVSLGFGGTLVLKFDNFIVNGLNLDVGVVETTYGSPPCANYPEKAEIYGSQDGLNWTYLGLVCTDGQVDLGSLSWAKYIKLVDVSDINASYPNTPNPDGFDVDGVQALNCGTEPNLIGQSCNGSWNLTDITTQKFYNFSDVKPGDYGKNVISFHVYNNNGWACLGLENKQDNENVCNDPELAVPDTSCSTGPTDGELSQYMNAFIWRDDGDGIYEPLQGETQITGGNFFEDWSIPIADSSTGGPLIASNTKYIGLAWCAGTISVNDWGGLTCDGSSMGDITQTDQLVTDVVAYTEQFRNNPVFYCNPLP